MSVVWVEACQIIGKILEMIGILWTAGKLLSIRPRWLPRVLFSSLWKGKASRQAIKIMDYVSNPREMLAIRGLALILIGLLLQALPYTINMFPELLYGVAGVLYG